MDLSSNNNYNDSNSIQIEIQKQEESEDQNQSIASSRARSFSRFEETITEDSERELNEQAEEGEERVVVRAHPTHPEKPTEEVETEGE